MSKIVTNKLNNCRIFLKILTNEIEIKGLTLDQAQKITPKFKVPNDLLTKFVSILTGNIGYKIMEKIPELNKIKCKKCGQVQKVIEAHLIKV